MASTSAFLFLFELKFGLKFLAQLFLKKTSRSCHSPVVRGIVVQKLTFSNISVITEDVYLKLRLIVFY